MFLLPYRSKNPPERPPYATIGLIVANTIVYIFTTKNLAEIKWGVVTDLAASPSHCNPWRIFASLFLHAEPTHLLGNMLFLWIFGAALEGRMRIPRYLLLYFTAGFAGGLAEIGTQMLAKVDVPGFGASGAIMGLAGAYMYVFPFARIMVFRVIFGFTRFMIGPAEWLSWWVVAYYMALNIVNGLIAQSLRIHSGTAYFDHIGGFCGGMGLAMLLKVRRDSEQISDVQATRANLNNDLGLMSASELETILEAPTENMEMVLIYCNKAIGLPGDVGEKKALKMIERYKEPLLDRGDPEVIASTLLKIPKDTGGVSGPFYLKLGGKLEALKKYDTAAYIYRRVFDIDPYSPDSNAAILRFGRIWETVYQDVDMARDAYEVYIKLFPNGPLIEEAEKGLARVGGTKVVAPIIRQTTIKKTFVEDESAEKAPMYATAFPAEIGHEVAAAEPSPDTARAKSSASRQTQATGAADSVSSFQVPNPFAED
jgi:membrane associated rhomboid family serine protease